MERSTISAQQRFAFAPELIASLSRDSTKSTLSIEVIQ